MFEFFFSLCHNLKVAQLIGPIDWIMHEDITDIFECNPLASLEVLVLSNTSSSLMHLGMQTVRLFLDKCHNLVGLGDLKTWRKIDYFDPDSDLFCKNDSAFCNLKRDAQKRNWEIDFDIENCLDLK